MKNSVKGSLGIVGVVAALGCGSDDEPAPRSASEFCTAWAEAACTEEVLSACQSTDADACRESQRTYCLGLLPDNFAEVGGDACLGAVRNAYEDADLEGEELDTVIRLGPPCDRLAAGAGRGEVCVEDNDCDRGMDLACVIKGGEEEGFCVVPEVVEAGRSCEAIGQTCEAGFFCNGDNCIEGRRAGQPCTNGIECAQDTYCDGSECQARRTVGEPCEFDEQCLEGLCLTFEGEDTCTSRIRLARAEPLCDELR